MPATRSWSKPMLCLDCQGDIEWYMVHDELWSSIGLTAGANVHKREYLCFGCLEKRLGRKLVLEDFPNDNPLNHAMHYAAKYFKKD